MCSCNREDYEDEVLVRSDLEKVSDKFFTTKGPVKLSGAKYRSDINSRSGSFSLRLDKKGQKALKGSVENVQIGDEIKISVWKSGKGKKNGELVLIVGHMHFFKETTPVKKEGDWDLLEFNITMPMEFKGSRIRWYVTNKGNDEVFFDDFYFKLKRNNGLQLKEHPTLSKVNIKIKDEGLEKIEKKRLFALEKGVLISNSDDWVKTNISWNNEKKKAKIRLKGDWTDHLYGQKFSLRVNVSKGKTLNGYSKFSIQNPVSRYFLDEWFIHKVLINEGILTTRYSFVDLYINNKSKGLYAVEEHFTKELLSSQGRDEGPIFKFSEDDIWESRFRNDRKDIRGIPWYSSSMIESFSQKRIVENEDLRKAFYRGRELMFNYQFRRDSAHKVLDIKKMAAYLALMDLSKGYHAMIWHNQRFYYNEKNDLLEPLVYDIFQETSHIRKSPINFLGETYIRHKRSYFVNNIDFLFQDAGFVKWYIHYLEKFSKQGYFEKAKAELEEELAVYEKEINSEYDFYSFNLDLYSESASYIREKLPNFKKKIESMLHENYSPFYGAIKVDPNQLPIENVSLHAYLQFLPDQTRMQVQSFYYDELEIVGVVIENRNEFFAKPIRLSPYRVVKAPETIEINVNGLPSEVLYKTALSDSLFSQEIIRFRAPVEEE